MLMEISHYGYYKSADSDAKKENAKFGEVKENTKENSKDKVQEYYKKLCKNKLHNTKDPSPIQHCKFFVKCFTRKW